MSTSTISVDQWAALSTLSSNINQIAARLNSRPDDPVVSADRAVLADLDDLLRDVRLRLLSVEPSS
jgi:predicted metalloprotease